MNPYSLTVISLLGAMIAHVVITSMAIGAYFSERQKPGLSRAWLAVAIGSTLFAVHHAYTLELALKTGLYDMRQAVFIGLAAIFIGLGVYGFRRQTP